MAIRLCPDDHTFYSNRSAAYLKDKKFSEALKDGCKCVELAPEWSKGYTRQGAAFYSLKMYKSALKAYTKVCAACGCIWCCLEMGWQAHELDPENAATKQQLDDVTGRCPTLHRCCRYS